MSLKSWVVEILLQFLEPQQKFSFTLMRIFETATSYKDISNGDPDVGLDNNIKFEFDIVDESLQ